MNRFLFAALLITTWPDGTIQKSPAIDEKICQIAASYDLSRGAKSAYCVPNLDPIAAGFKPGWDCIKSFNC